jgi:phosphoglycerate dehydrogenase-like enzyme
MTVTVAMYDGSYDHIGARLDALGLDINIITFDKDAQFTLDGQKVPTSEVEADYLWFSSHLHALGATKPAFEMVTELKRLDVLQTFNAGLDHPMYKRASDKGIRICNSSAQGVAIAEYVMAQVMGILHPLRIQAEQQVAKEWKTTPFREISRTRWLIIGYGPIGEALATRVHAFGAKIDVIRRSDQADDRIERVGVLEDAGKLAADADIIVLACSLTDTTRGFADAEFFAQVKPGAVLVNIARGALINDAALIKALDDGTISEAALDVFHKEPLPKNDPLWTHPKVRLTPHTSFAGDGGRDRWDQLFLDNIVRYVNGEALEREVNPADIV